MQAITNRFTFLFRSTKGLVLVAIAMISVVTAIWGTLSGPMVEWGVKDITVRLLGMRLVEAEREGRIVMLYHTIAMAVVAIEVYFITLLIPMKQGWRAIINATITVGYMTAMVFGLLFAYFGHVWAFHGLFLFGQSLIFFAGLMLAAALWPWSKEYRVVSSSPGQPSLRGRRPEAIPLGRVTEGIASPSARNDGRSVEYATWKGIDLERAAFFAMAVATLGSSLFGAVPGSYFGNGFETFLAENVVREVEKTALDLAIIGHLHIMLTLIAVALALLVGRWLDFRGPLHKMAMPLMIAGTITITLGVWLVVPFEEIAHYIIYVGSVGVLLAALLLVIYGFRKLINDNLGDQKATPWKKVQALLRDPVRFGMLWQMVYMNFVVTAIGLFMAIRLDKVIRVWPWREERVTLTGHWHILAAIIATIILFLYADYIGLKGRARQWFGWVVIIASDVAFGAVALFSTRRLYVTESAQQPLVDWVMAFTDLGLAMVLVALAILMLWRLVDLCKAKGLWATELAETGEEVAK